MCVWKKGMVLSFRGSPTAERSEKGLKFLPRGQLPSYTMILPVISYAWSAFPQYMKVHFSSTVTSLFALQPSWDGSRESCSWKACRQSLNRKANPFSTLSVFKCKLSWHSFASWKQPKSSNLLALPIYIIFEWQCQVPLSMTHLFCVQSYLLGSTQSKFLKEIVQFIFSFNTCSCLFFNVWQLWTKQSILSDCQRTTNKSIHFLTKYRSWITGDQSLCQATINIRINWTAVIYISGVYM